MKKNSILPVALALMFSANISAQTSMKQSQVPEDSVIMKGSVIEKQEVAADSIRLVEEPAVYDTDRMKQNNDSLETVIDLKSEENSALMAENAYLKAALTDGNNKKQDKVWGRKKYFNLAYNFEKLTSDDELSMFSENFGASITIGRTYYLHKKPILGMIKFGLDWSYVDINVAGYNCNTYEETYSLEYSDEYSDESNKYNLYKMELGMQFGPSVTVNPIDYLKFNVYFRYSPSYSFILDEEFQFGGSYGSYMNFGLAASYKVISLGYEYRWGTSKIDYYDAGKWDAKGSKIYISFRY